MLENHKKICSTGSTRKNLVFFSVLTSKNVMISEVCYTKKGMFVEHTKSFFLTFLANCHTWKGLSHLKRYVKLSHLERFVKLSHLERYVTLIQVCDT